MPENSDNIFLYASHALAITQYLSVIQIRIETLETKRFAINKKLQTAVRYVLDKNDVWFNFIFNLHQRNSLK